MSQMELIRRELESHIGKKIILKANKGRKKIVTRKGVLKALYPSIFVVDIIRDQKTITSSFTYSDVLTKNVSLTILDDSISFNDIKKIS